MGLSIRARRWLDEQQRQRAADRAAAEAARDAAREKFHRDWMDRHRVADALRVSVHKLKRMTAAGLGPTPAKSGDTKQSRTYWHREEVAAYLANPAQYEARKSSC